MFIPRPTTMTGWGGYALGSLVGIAAAAYGLFRLAVPAPIDTAEIIVLIAMLLIAPLLYVVTALTITETRRSRWNHAWAVVSYLIGGIWAYAATNYILIGLAFPSPRLLAFGAILLPACLMLIYLAVRLQFATTARRRAPG